MKKRLLLLVTLQLVLLSMLSSCNATKEPKAWDMAAPIKVSTVYPKTFLQDQANKDKSNFRFKKRPGRLASLINF